MIFFLIIFVLATLVLLAWVIYKMEEVDERQEELDKYSVHLDERANMLAMWEAELHGREAELYRARNPRENIS